jgi:ATP-dependent Lon protease
MTDKIIHLLPAPDKDQYHVVDPKKYKHEIIESQLNGGSENLIERLALPRPSAFPAHFEQALKALEELMTLAPNLRGFIELVLSLLKLHPQFSLRHPFRLVPILLLGPPGIGKTFIANKIAAAIGICCGRINLSNATEAFILSGCPKGYSSSTPGDVARRMSEAHCINPIIILDELDKASFARHERPSIEGPILQMLEPETARRFEDSSLKCELDVSHVSWLATANRLEGIPAPVLSRFHIINVVEATEAERMGQIDYYTQTTLKEMELLNRVEVTVSPEAAQQFIHLDVRAWKMKLRLAIALKIHSSDSGQNLVIEPSDLKALTHETAKRSIGFVHN